MTYEEGQEVEVRSFSGGKLAAKVVRDGGAYVRVRFADGRGGWPRVANVKRSRIVVARPAYSLPERDEEERGHARRLTDSGWVDARKPDPRPVPKPKPAKRSRRYLSFVRTFPCLCGCGQTPVEAHHFGENHGMARKASDFTAVPLSAGCHRAFHTLGHLPSMQGGVATARLATEHAFYREQSRLLRLWIEAEGFVPSEEEGE